MSAVAKVLDTIIEKTGRATAGSHSLKRAASTTCVLLHYHYVQYIGTNNNTVDTTIVYYLPYNFSYF